MDGKECSAPCFDAKGTVLKPSRAFRMDSAFQSLDSPKMASLKLNQKRSSFEKFHCGWICHDVAHNVETWCILRNRMFLLLLILRFFFIMNIYKTVFEEALMFWEHLHATKLSLLGQHLRCQQEQSISESLEPTDNTPSTNWCIKVWMAEDWKFKRRASAFYEPYKALNLHMDFPFDVFTLKTWFKTPLSLRQIWVSNCQSSQAAWSQRILLASRFLRILSAAWKKNGWSHCLHLDTLSDSGNFMQIW